MEKPFGSLVYENFDIDYSDELFNETEYAELLKQQEAIRHQLDKKALELFSQNTAIEGEIEGIIERIYFTQGFNLGVNAGIEFANQKFPKKK